MDIKVISQDKNNLNLLIKDTDYVYVNTLRRIMLSEIPILAIKSVKFIKNTSALFDEIIAHRLGLLPLKTNLKTYTLTEECKCKEAGCAKCQSNITLNCEGPLTVYASDLKFKDPDVKPIYPKIPIVKLHKNQELEIEAVVTLGFGKNHSKYAPGHIYYKGYPKIKIGDKCNNCGECVNACPKNIYKIESRKLQIQNIEDCHLCEACVDICPKNALDVKGSQKDFILYIESYGNLEPKELLQKALDICDEKLDEFSKRLKKSKKP